ncbi:MAG: hypothetical protein SA339_09430 [Methanomassiliicoccus sp.]|nr:hypothetical protein [Methanomassiliicoccus sp.]
MAKRDERMTPIRMSSEYFGTRDFETPEEASRSINRLDNRAELVDELGNTYSNTAPNIRFVTERRKEATIRDKVSKEEIGTIRGEED